MTERGNGSLVERLAKLWLAWFCVYMATGAFAMMQQNLPLQIVLALTALQLNKSSSTGTRKVGNTISVINTVLIVVHIVISFAVRIMQ